MVRKYNEISWKNNLLKIIQMNIENVLDFNNRKESKEEEVRNGGVHCFFFFNLQI